MATSHLIAGRALVRIPTRTMDTIYDVVVVGNGMFGAAATRHLSARGLRVVAVGPDEPADWKTHDGVFSSHYDQGRITRIIDADPVWAQLAQRSIAVYPELEAQSGIGFHHRSGGVWIYPQIPAALVRLQQADAVGRTFGAEFERLTDKEVMARFRYLQVPSNAITLWERGPAGHIDPRSIVRAQLAVAGKQGATILRQTATGYSRRNDVFEVTTDGGTRVRAAKLLIAAGAYTNHLLARPMAMQLKARTVLLAEIDETEARRLQALPSTIQWLADDPVLESVYSTPAVRYPDGKLYIKIGGSRHTPHLLETPQEFRKWFQAAGDAEELAALRSVLLALLPGLRAISFGAKPCVVAYTAHNRPYIDRLDGDQGFVVAGGCGAGAKSCDEIGRVAAGLVEAGAWSYDLPAETFAARWQ
jgi:glycine/D-amino acid oxidase-like deaminating enzyme